MSENTFVVAGTFHTTSSMDPFLKASDNCHHCKYCKSYHFKIEKLDVNKVKQKEEKENLQEK